MRVPHVRIHAVGKQSRIVPYIYVVYPIIVRSLWSHFDIFGTKAQERPDIQ